MSITVSTPSTPPPATRQPAGINRWLQIFLTIIAGAAVAVIAWTVVERFLHILILLLAGFLLVFLLGPLVDRLQARGLPRALAIALIYLTIIVGLSVAGVLLVGPLTSQLQDVTKNIPNLTDSNNGAVSQIDNFLQSHGIPFQIESIQNQVVSYITNASASLLGGTLAVVTGLVSFVTDLFLVLAITFYLLLDGQNMRNSMVRLLPTRYRERWFFVEATLNRVLGGYIRGQILVALTVGVAAGLGSWALGVHYPLVIGLLAFLFEFIPLLGPVLGMVPAVIIALFQPFPLVLWVIVYFIVLQQVESNVIVPRISGHAVGLHPLAALLALLAGVELGGLGGALLAVPLAGVLYVIALAIYSDATHQTELLITPPRRPDTPSLRWPLGRPRDEPAPPSPAEPAQQSRLTEITEDQAHLMAQFEAHEADAAATATAAGDSAKAAATAEEESHTT